MATGNNERGEAQREAGPTTAPAKRGQPNGETRLLLHSAANRRFVAFASAKGRLWQPPEGLTSAGIKAVVAAATIDRDRLLRRCLWATGGRVSEVLTLRPADI